MTYQNAHEPAETFHNKVEKNVILMAVLCLIAVSIGGLVQILPLFFLENTIEKVEGMRPYTPLELIGRNIYIREGCYLCHSQQIRPFRDEAERYGHYSLAAESMYDHPFQWGSKRTGPDLARVGQKYSNEWHTAHLINPRSIVPESIMPTYGFLANTALDRHNIGAHLKTLRLTGVPYTDDQIANAEADVLAQLDPDGDSSGLTNRYGSKVVVQKFDTSNPKTATELDALISYLQMLGTLVDFSKYDAAKYLR